VNTAWQRYRRSVTLDVKLVAIYLTHLLASI
jgi:hypothetical protein